MIRKLFAASLLALSMDTNAAPASPPPTTLEGYLRAIASADDEQKSQRAFAARTGISNPERTVKALETASAAEEHKLQLTFALARRISPAHMDKVLKDWDGTELWHLNALTADLDDDRVDEQILLFWIDDSFDGLLYIMKKSSGSWRTIYAEQLQGWSYVPPTLFMVNNESGSKWVVCHFETIAHASGMHESRYRVLAVIKGKVKTLLDIPADFFNYCQELETHITPIHGGLRISVTYTYFNSNGVTPESPMFTCKGEMNMKWNETLGAFVESYGENSKLNANKFHYMTGQKILGNPSFSAIWKDELAVARKNGRIQKK